MTLPEARAAGIAPRGSAVAALATLTLQMIEWGTYVTGGVGKRPQFGQITTGFGMPDRSKPHQ